jgi:hypothetical protein
MHRMRRLVALAGLALVSSPLLASTASAALIRPAAGRAYPDIAADINGVVNYTYNSSTGTGQFHVTNTPYLIAGGPTSAQEFGVSPNGDGIRQQVLNVMTDSAGNLVSSSTNSYALYGTIVADGETYSGLLLSGTPKAFGFQDLDSVGIVGSDVFDVEMDVTGGELAKFFGATAYMRITPELQSTFVGKFDQNFSAAKATSNTRSYNSPQPFPVPEPAAVLVLLAGGLGWVHRHRRRMVQK